MNKLRFSAPVRILRRRLGRVARILHRRTADPSVPPVVVNSFPKSGTHLLHQMVQSTPGLVDFREFIASTPSLTLREIAGSAAAGKIRRLAPGELCRAHLFHSPEASAALRERSAVHLLIIRDLRDVVVSEAHYLTFMNRWHRLHRVFRNLETAEDRLLLAIRGATEEPVRSLYPDVGARFARYAGWLRPEAGVRVVRYEELRGASPEQVRGLAAHVAQGLGTGLDPATLATAFVQSVDPSDSHTFRKGGRGDWRSMFTDRCRDAFKEVAGPLLVELGYEENGAW